MTQNLKSKNSKILKIVLIFLTLCIGSYYGFKYYKKIVREKQEKQNELSRFNNIESEIFDLSDETSAGGYEKIDDRKLSELTLSELKENGAEFIYQLLLHNQVQIGNIKSDLNNLKTEFNKYKSQEKLIKMTMIYVDFRHKFYNDQDYKKNLESFEILAISDNSLKEKTEILKINLQNLQNFSKLEKEFKDLIPSIIAAKKHDYSGNWFEKLRFKMAKLVTIRNTNVDLQTIDGSVERCIQNLRNQDYQSVFEEINSMDDKYKIILKNFIINIKYATEIRKTDQEILLYLQSLS